MVGDWWMEENGLLMESPDFPLPEGQYLVTGGRETQAVLKVSGDSWSLSHEAKLSDVTHLPCRSARSGDPPSPLHRIEIYVLLINTQSVSWDLRIPGSVRLYLWIYGSKIRGDVEF